MDPADVIIIGVEIFPDHRLASKHCTYFAQARGSDGLRNDERPGPENSDLGIKLGAEHVQIGRAWDVVSCHGSAIFGRTKKQMRTRLPGSQMGQRRVGKMTLRSGKTAEGLHVRLGHRFRDVVEEQGELRDSEVEELVQSALQGLKVGMVRIDDAEARRYGDHQVKAALLRGVKQSLEL